MAAVANVEMVTISINDIEIEVPKGELIVESVKRLGLEIPIFCYHPRMKPVGMCRMCLVEVGFKQADGSVRKMPKPQAGCTLPADNNMVIYTDTEMVHNDRRGVLEFLLINHPLDCPICDRGGECPLQNNTLAYGPSTSRFVEMKRHLPKAFPLSQYVTLDLERCIQCGRCVRFTEEISGDHDLAFRFRGAEMQPTTFQLSDFESKFSGNVIEICPVGALTSARYRFRARPWDLETRPGICTVTACGTNVWFDFRAGKFVRINGRTNEAVNEEWTCDRTKFGHDFYNSPDRVFAPNLRSDVGFRSASWSEAYSEILKAFGDGNVGALVGQQLANEDYFALKKLFGEAFHSQSVDHRMSGPWLNGDDRLSLTGGEEAIQTTIAELEFLDSALIFGVNLADDAPMSHLRLRKGWFQHGLKLIVANDEPSEAESFAAVVLRYKPGTEQAVAAALQSAVAGGKVSDNFEAETGVPVDRLSQAAEVLREGNRAILTTRSLLTKTGGITAISTLSELAKASGTKMSILAVGANEQGAMEVGILPSGGGLNTREMLEAARDGKLKALWLVGCDPLVEFADRALAEQALESVPFLVVQTAIETEACQYASVILPMTLPAEQDGTYTNYERRTQLMQQIIPAVGDAKPSWRIFSEVLVRKTPATPPFGTKDIFAEMASTIPAFGGQTYAAIPDAGFLPHEAVEVLA